MGYIVLYVYFNFFGVCAFDGNLEIPGCVVVEEGVEGLGVVIWGLCCW